MKAWFKLLLCTVIACTFTSVSLAQSAPVVPLVERSDFKTLERQIQNVVDDVREAVVGIRAGQGTGSGTLISEDGWVSTAAHVIQWKSGLKATIVMPDGRTYKGESVGSHQQMDYGLIKVDTKGDKLPYVELGESSKIIGGQWLIAMGHPLGILPGRAPVVRAGRSLGLNQQGMIVTDTPLINGDSGGPIFDLSGKMIAMTSSGDPTRGWVNNITPVDGFKALLDRLKAGEVIGRQQGGRQQGAAGQNGIPGLNKKQSQTFMEATQQMRGGDYESAATSLDELIAKVDNPHMMVLYNAACAFSLWASELSGVERDEKAERAVEYLNRTLKAGWVDLDHIKADPDFDAIRGRADYERFVNDLRRAIFKPLFGLEVDETKAGVEVVSVLENSPAAILGFEVGDVIQRMGDYQISDAIDYANALSNVDRSSLTTFDVERSGETVTIKWAVAPKFSGGMAGFGQDKTAFKNSETLLNLWSGSDLEKLRSAVYTVKQKKKQVSFATAIDRNGFLITKASELNQERDIVIVDDDGNELVATIVAEDSETDIALLRVEQSLPSVVDFDYRGESPQIGTFLGSVDAGGKAFAYGISALNAFNSNGIANQPFIGLLAEETETGQGIIVTKVVPGGPASEAGIVPEDLLTMFNEEPIDSFFGLITMVNAREPGDEVMIEGVRGGEPIVFDVVLAKRSDVVDSRGRPLQEGGKPKLVLGFSAQSEAGVVTITKVVEESAAEKAGLSVGDQIVSINGDGITSNGDIKALLDETQAGDVWVLKLSNDGAERFVELVVEAKPEGRPYVGFMPDPTFTGEGVAIGQVNPETPAEAAGLQTGDVIVEFNGVEIVEPMDLMDAIQAASPGQRVSLSVLRDGETVTVELTLGVHPGESGQPVPQPAPQTPKLGATLAEGGEEGLEVTKIKENSMAARFGLRVGDIVRRANGTDLTSLDQFREILTETIEDEETLRLAITRVNNRGKAQKGVIRIPFGPQAGPPRGPGGQPDARGPMSERASELGSVIQHDAVVLPNQCGAPIVDVDGNVRGFNIARGDRTRTFALSSERVNEAIQRLMEQASKEE